MPFWGNYVILVITLLAMFLLVWAWIIRRKATLRATTISLHKALAWFTIAGLALWTLALAASIWIIVRPEPVDSIIGSAVPEYTLDLIFALAAIGTIVVLARDLSALSHKVSTLGDEEAI
jgi:hypothetical protein